MSDGTYEQGFADGLRAARMVSGSAGDVDPRRPVVLTDMTVYVDYDHLDNVRFEQVRVRPCDVTTVTPRVFVTCEYWGRREREGCAVRLRGGAMFWAIGDPEEICASLGYGGK